MDARQYGQLWKQAEAAKQRATVAAIFAALALICVVGFKIWDEYRLRRAIGAFSNAFESGARETRRTFQELDEAQRRAADQQRQAIQRINER